MQYFTRPGHGEEPIQSPPRKMLKRHAIAAVPQQHCWRWHHLNIFSMFRFVSSHSQIVSYQTFSLHLRKTPAERSLKALRMRMLTSVVGKMPNLWEFTTIVCEKLLLPLLVENYYPTVKIEWQLLERKLE